MIDTFTLRGLSGHTPEKLIETIDNVQERDTYTSGKLGPLTVHVRPDGMIKVNGSLPKYVAGDNRFGLGFMRDREALLALLDILAIPPEFAYVTRLDCGTSVYLTAPVTRYLRELSTERVKYQSRSRNSKTFYLGIGAEICCYDKMAEQKSKRSTPSLDLGAEPHRGSHLLRIELRLTKQIRSRLGIPSDHRRAATVANILHPLAYRKMIALWVDSFRSIKTIPTLIPQAIQEFSGTSDFVNCLAAEGLQRIGAEAVQQLIEQCSNRTVKCRLKKKSEALSKYKSTQLISQYRDELDAAMDEIVYKQFKEISQFREQNAN
jgi:hypothetical protein